MTPFAFECAGELLQALPAGALRNGFSEAPSGSSSSAPTMSRNTETMRITPGSAHSIAASPNADVTNSEPAATTPSVRRHATPGTADRATMPGSQMTS